MDRTQPDRLLSLDFLRGLIMVLLVLESTSLFEHLFEASQGTFTEGLFIQFFHHPWNGLRFWDLIQPGFMFMAGTAMALSLHKQTEAGITWNKQFIKILKRCGLLFFWGVLDYAVRPKGLSFELWDVLTQLSFTTLLAFLIFRFSTTTQIGISIGLLLFTEFIYRYTNLPGFNQPFVDQHNVGNYIDLLLMNKVNNGGWVAINCLPTAAHTIWGALAGKLLLNTKDNAHKINALLVAGVMCLAVGYFMDWTITPIIKRIATSSFTIASGGWCLIALAICYWWIDLRGHKQKLFFFTVVGMNSIFIYLFIEIVASRWFNGYVGAITNGLMMLASLPTQLMLVITSLCIFSCEWFLCYWLYKKNIFFKL
jgi:predicted acyltransferase